MPRRKTWKDLVREKQADIFNQEGPEKIKPKEEGKIGRCSCGGSDFKLAYENRELVRTCQICGAKKTV